MNTISDLVVQCANAELNIKRGQVIWCRTFFETSELTVELDEDGIPEDRRWRLLAAETTG